MSFTSVEVGIAVGLAKGAAFHATKNYLEKYGDRDACGFAWITVYDVRSNSKLGKALIENGFRKAYGGGLQLWNPSGSGAQSISALEAGAEEAAEVLGRLLHIKVYSGSRMD